MTHRAVYASLVDRIFGAGVAVFGTAVTESNNVIGALATPTNFAAFNANFEERLRRLNAAIQVDPSLRNEVLAAVNRVAADGWDGAYAELCALDYFLAGTETGPGKIQLDRTVAATETLASEMGMQNANHDLRFPALGVSMDTKILSDKTGQILDGIFDAFRAAKGINRLMIVPTYDLDDDFTPYRDNRMKLLDELVNGVDVNAKPATLASKVVPGLSYEFAWDAGAYMSGSSYSPVEHATRHHPLLFGHIKKFSRVEPTAIVYVLFPWSGERMFLFDHGKPRFMKEFGEQFFNNYVRSTDAVKKYNSKVKSAITAGDVTRHLSGVIYLDDRSITAPDPKQVNVAASFIWNKNAVHPLAGHALDGELRRRGAVDLGAVN